MDVSFGLYPRLYAKRKDLLFPVIEKYSGQSLSGKTHGQVIQLYFGLLKTNIAFKDEIDGIIIKYSDKLLKQSEKAEMKAAQKEIRLKGGQLTQTNYSNASGNFRYGVLDIIGNAFELFSTKAQAKADSDAAFYQAVLAAQKEDNTTKILVVSGIALAFVGMGVFLVIKMRKK